MISYAIIHPARPHRIKIAVHSDGSVVVSAPKRVSDAQIAKIVAARREWIERVVKKYKKMTIGLQLENDSVDQKEFKKIVSDLIVRRAGAMNVTVGKLSIRKMRSRWGSCSREGNISINLLLGHLSEELLEYVIVHELCHIVHHNHSKSFWSLVRAYLPDFKRHKTLLKKFGYLLRQKKPE